jgi:hypothetical protein
MLAPAALGDPRRKAHPRLIVRAGPAVMARAAARAACPLRPVARPGVDGGANHYTANDKGQRTRPRRLPWVLELSNCG